MESLHFSSSTGERAVLITRVAQRHWHALEDDRVVGRGEATHRPDGRVFLSIDAWHREVFDQLAEAMLPGLPKPLHTVVDEADVDLTAQWERAGFTIRRREWEYLVPTDPGVTGLGSVLPPPGVKVLAVGEAEEAPLRAVDRVIRDEVEAAVGWHEMPTEILVRPDGDTVVDPSKYAAAAQTDGYVGLARVVTFRQPRIGLIAVRSDRRRRGVARALLAEVLGSLHRSGQPTASADVNESNAAAVALFEGVGARRAGSNLELVLR
ncbi:GNAT family N-acetyltransferase [Amycolatopsis saalfeldensis]|uniref:Acetyltransferase (GNAT) family protein n=1 Tax=Amycolatopsis saalfeldensis TaxID=394193 RepID=A0A1H8YL30_9PSEU|nr:GNAT family N-acetyltransferase [Amycolatopsis saalfeldensis]SEP52803.1 Acetyltransferase (GNAT) family protein [Amycolatopsis saalfeldensis]